FRELKKKTQMGGGLEKLEEQHRKGKLSARERVQLLLDPNTFIELDLFAKHQGLDFGMAQREIAGDAVITGFGQIAGRPVALYAQDFTTLGGTVGERHGSKICKLYDKAGTLGIPVIGLIDSGGVRAQESLGGYIAYSRMFYRHINYSGVIPQISLMLGPCGGGASYSPALTDFIFMTKKTSFMYIAGPALTKSVTSKDYTEAELGGPEVHAKISGCCDLVGEDDADTIQKGKDLLSYLPINNQEPPPFQKTQDDPYRLVPELEDIVPGNEKRPYNMYEIIQRIVDEGRFFEIKPDYAKQIITCFARFGGIAVGILASQPMVLAGSMDINASDKATRFIRFCDAFHIPLVNLVDVPGYLPGVEQEHGGIIRHGAKMLFAYGEATTTKIHLIIRKGYAGASIGMCSKELGADAVFIWPTGAILTMGPSGASEIVFRKEIMNAKPEDRGKITQEMEEEYKRIYYNPYKAASIQQVDEIIEPQQTRERIYTALRLYEKKKDQRPWKKHGNMPM
ncbi:MAG: acyl-CoA carboxylase subunit beta, partial [Deltaproteobacteria bacterium]|nr:acyl-CoA carboxylase subunit beta [Deltaproteobacteria bacterium]